MYKAVYQTRGSSNWAIFFHRVTALVELNHLGKVNIKSLFVNVVSVEQENMKHIEEWS